MLRHLRRASTVILALVAVFAVGASASLAQAQCSDPPSDARNVKFFNTAMADDEYKLVFKVDSGGNFTIRLECPVTQPLEAPDLRVYFQSPGQSELTMCLEIGGLSGSATGPNCGASGFCLFQVVAFNGINSGIYSYTTLPLNVTANYVLDLHVNPATMPNCAAGSDRAAEPSAVRWFDADVASRAGGNSANTDDAAYLALLSAQAAVVS